MKQVIKSALSGATALGLAGAMVLAGGGVANAATPPYDPGSNGATQGTLSLYNAAGDQITSGPLATPPAYVRANTDTGRAGDTLASIYAATPVEGQNALTWPNDLIASGKAYPSASAPASLQGSPLALGSGIFAWLDPSDPDSYASGFPNTNSTASWQNLYQLRVITSGPGQAGNTQRYASASIQINSAAGTWTQVYPTVAATATTTTLGASPASPSDSGTPITLTATVSPAGAAGSVEFFDGASSLGSSAVSGGTATKSNVTLPVGTRSLTAVFTPTNPGSYVGSTSAVLSYVSNAAPAADTATALGVNPTSGPAYAAVVLTANVTRVSNGAAVGSGNVKFFDGAVQIGSGAVSATGEAVLNYSNFAAGAHSLTAQFVPANAAVFNGSTSAAVSATYDAPANPDAIDPQTVVVNVPAGSLSITTPYGPSNPFDLGTMVLDSNGVGYSASKPFPNVAAGDRLAITDTRAGDLPWTAYVTTTDFTNAGTGVIDGANLSFTNVTPGYIAGNALNGATKPVVTANVPSVKGGPHQFASAAQGAGSVYVVGDLGLTAPSSTTAGLYTATVTFTVS